MKVVVTGGAGYIGSFMAKKLLEAKNEVIVLDSLERGHRELIDKNAVFEQVDLREKEKVELIFKKHKPDAVIHFAGLISVGESMQKPNLYFVGNIDTTLNLLEAMRLVDCKKLIFSSTAAVYGNPTIVPIPENHSKEPTSVYGESKLMIEHILKWYQSIYGLRFVALRYFNACGAALDGSSGEWHPQETHIIPCAINALLNNQEFTLFGTDYKTFDGTCVRDYIHVLDLVEAHMLALSQIDTSVGGNAYNVGTGTGFSNKQVLEMIERISGKSLKVITSPRRAGDADQLVANVDKIKTELHFIPTHSDLETIIASAWKWHIRLHENQ